MSTKNVFTDGLWKDNVIFTQLLALCPLMAVTTTATNGFGMGAVTTLVLVASNLLVSLIRSVVPNQIRIPIFTLLIAALVTLVDLGMNAWMHDLHKVLGLFIALIVVNCAILGRAEAYAMKNPPLLAMLDGLGMGLGFTLSMTIMGDVAKLLAAAHCFQALHCCLALILNLWNCMFFPVTTGSY